MRNHPVSPTPLVWCIEIAFKTEIGNQIPVDKLDISSDLVPAE